MKTLNSKIHPPVVVPAASLANESDRMLWVAFRAGSREAFELLYTRHIQSLIHYGSKITSDRSLIQDSIQDLFVELWQSRTTLSQVHSTKPYLLRSLRYKIVKSLQKNPTQTLDEAELPLDMGTLDNPILAQEDSHRYAHQLAAALDQLPRRQKEAIHLRYYQELSNEEVAQMMGVNYQSACKFIYTALRTLRNKLQLISILPLLLTPLIFFE